MVKKPDEIKKIANRLADALKAKGIKVKRIILYGSYAKGNPKPYSDIDLAVISPDFNNKGLLKRQELLGEIIFSLGEPIEALGYSDKEFKNPPELSFLSEIITKGKVVYRG
jgi:predicted nucleotidyltransferase